MGGSAHAVVEAVPGRAPEGARPGRRRRLTPPPFLWKRGVGAVIAVWGVLTAVFVLLNISGNPAVLLLPVGAPASEVAHLSQSLGYNDPLIVQYLLFLGRTLSGHFPNSLEYGTPALGVVFGHVGATLELVASALVLAVIGGMVSGYVGAFGRYGWLRTAAVASAVVMQSIPVFILGVFLVLVFSLRWSILPASGDVGIQALILPAVTLSGPVYAPIARIFRTTLLEVAEEPHVRTAVAKGISLRSVRWRHVMGNALLPVITVVGLQAGTLLGGTVIVETVFAWPGIGQLAILAVNSRDYPVILADTLVISLGFVVANFAVDILYMFLDPRVRQRL
jgi:ABC-type dipeptide/oligopeptide/nickel transport system permease component